MHNMDDIITLQFLSSTETANMYEKYKLSKPHQHSRYYKLCTGIFTLLLLGAAIILAIYYGVKYYEMLDRVQHEKSAAEEASPSQSEIITSNSTEEVKLSIIQRNEWLAQPPVHDEDPLKHPVPYVVILHTDSKNCSTQAECGCSVRDIQTYHIKIKNWSDIGYSFLVGGDGLAYEGRGWDRIGAFIHGYNNISIGIAFIGNFKSELPPPKQISVAKLLIAEGVKSGKISKNYKLFAHRQLSFSESPGEMFFKNIKTWEHWTEKPDLPKQ